MATNAYGQAPNGAYAQPMIAYQPGMLPVGPPEGGTPTMMRLLIAGGIFGVGLIAHLGVIFTFSLDLLWLAYTGQVIAFIGLVVAIWAIIAHKPGFVKLQDGQVVPAHVDGAQTALRVISAGCLLGFTCLCCVLPFALWIASLLFAPTGL